MPWTFSDLRNTKPRKPSAKRSKADAANLREAWTREQRSRWKVTTSEALEADGVDFGIEMEEGEGR